MPRFTSDGLSLAYEVYGEGRPILLIHGFGSSGAVNWRGTGWIKTLIEAGYRAVTIDNRGHGDSEAPHDPERYYPDLMAGDALALLDHLGLERVPVIGFSMGARIGAFLALRAPERVEALVLGGMGTNLVTGLADSEEIIAGLRAATLAEITHPNARTFRIFAEHTKSDREALAACMATSRQPMPEEDVRRIEVPTLVVVGGEDVMAGSPEALAVLLPRGEAVTVERRDHMHTTGDAKFKAAALAFLDRHREDGKA